MRISCGSVQDFASAVFYPVSMPRTLSDAEADYAAARAAWLKSLQSEEYRTGTGNSNRRSKSAELYQQMTALAAEVKSLSRTAGAIRIRGGTPV